ncbi:MAG: hypothetical protein U0599_05180 [Vicinamibacteria bacterium]
MSALLSLVATNAATAAALALLAWAAGRALRRPAVVHGLWLLALAKLVTPPLVPLPVLPDWSALRIAPAAPRRRSGSRRRPTRRRSCPATRLLRAARPLARPAAGPGRPGGVRPPRGVAHGAPPTPPPARASDPASGLPSPGAVAAALLGLGSVVVTAVAWPARGASAPSSTPPLPRPTRSRRGPTSSRGASACAARRPSA